MENNKIKVSSREIKIIASAKLMTVKKWMKLSEVLKEFKCGYKDLILKSSSQVINPIPIGNDIYFFRDDLEKVFIYKTKYTKK